MQVELLHRKLETVGPHHQHRQESSFLCKKCVWAQLGQCEGTNPIFPVEVITVFVKALLCLSTKPLESHSGSCTIQWKEQHYNRRLMEISSHTLYTLTNGTVPSELERNGLMLVNHLDSGFLDKQKSPKILLIPSGKECPRNMQCLKGGVGETQLWIKMQISTIKNYTFSIKYDNISCLAVLLGPEVSRLLLYIVQKCILTPEGSVKLYGWCRQMLNWKIVFILSGHRLWMNIICSIIYSSYLLW